MNGCVAAWHVFSELTDYMSRLGSVRTRWEANVNTKEFNIYIIMLTTEEELDYQVLGSHLILQFTTIRNFPKLPSYFITDT